jgi:beta-lactamase class A
MNEEHLRKRIAEISSQSKLSALAVAVHDYQTGRSFDFEADRWFHAASVIKLAVLLGVFRAIDDGAFHLDDPVHVRNRFRSVADGSTFRVDRERDGDVEAHRRVGRTMRIAELTRAMIVRSSNLATNLLLDLVGLDSVRGSLSDAGVTGVRMLRGVEDNAAFDRGMNNEMTAGGARQLLRAMRESSFLQQASRDHIREILLAQEFNSMIPARLPSSVRVAHKTGEISTHSHDAGLVYPVEREPYVVAIFTQSEAASDPRSKVAAEVSAEVFEHLTA